MLNFLLKLTWSKCSDKCNTCFASGLTHVLLYSEEFALHREPREKTPNVLIKFTVILVQNHPFYMLLLNNLLHTQHLCPSSMKKSAIRSISFQTLHTDAALCVNKYIPLHMLLLFTKTVVSPGRVFGDSCFGCHSMKENI